MWLIFKLLSKVVKLIPAKHQGTDLPFNISFSFSAQIVEVILINITNQQEVYDSCIFTLCIIINQVGPFQLAQPGHNAIDNPVDAHNFADHGFEFRVKGMGDGWGSLEIKSAKLES